MARPIKTNADYFPHDSDMRNDPKVKALRRKFGHVGYSVWVMLLETLTDSDNFEIEFTSLNIELLSGDFDAEPDELNEILNYCKTVNLITEEEGFICSKRLKERFSTLITKRERYRKGVLDVDNSQSKVNKSKVNKSKVNIIEESIIEKGTRIDFSVLENHNWFENIIRMMEHKIDMDTLLILWNKFKIELTAKDDLYKPKEDYRKHFPSWVKIHADKLNTNGSSVMKPNYELLNQIQ